MNIQNKSAHPLPTKSPARVHFKITAGALALCARRTISYEDFPPVDSASDETVMQRIERLSTLSMPLFQSSVLPEAAQTLFGTSDDVRVMSATVPNADEGLSQGSLFYFHVSWRCGELDPATGFMLNMEAEQGELVVVLYEPDEEELQGKHLFSLR